MPKEIHKQIIDASTIGSIDKWDEDRDNKIIVHINGDVDKGDRMFWILPNVDDGSEEWKIVAEYLKIPGNEIEDKLKKYADVAYIDKRAVAYPDIRDQLDEIYHNGIDAWKETIKEVKDKYPKPTQEPESSDEEPKKEETGE